jgi:hypothetical protein
VFPGNIQLLWNTVRLAKDSNIDRSPKTLFREGVEIESESICDEYASYFYPKISKTLQEVSLDENVYKGKQKVKADDFMFMDPVSIKECLLSQKDKNNVGFDRIPHRALIKKSI